jgi:N-acetylglucosamine-6-phosphate deacetylase
LIVSSRAEEQLMALPVSGTSVLIAGRLLDGSIDIGRGVLAVEDGVISYAGPEDGFRDAGLEGAVRLGPGEMVVPGLIDLHCHGGFGVDFPSAGDADARRAVALLHARGTTSLLASLVTGPVAELLRGIGVLRPLATEGLIEGIHLEGPFLSAQRCGAQDPQWLLDPDTGLARELAAAAAGTLKTMTYAPELPGAGELAGVLMAAGVIPSLGHTNADGGTAARALAQVCAGLAGTADGAAAEPAGERAVGTVTHLFNGMAPMHHRDPGAVAASLRAAKAGTAVVELVADNTHLDPQTVLTVFDLVGAGNIALVTDSMAAAGLADGRYRLGTADVHVLDGAARLSSGSLAGGTATLLDVVRRTIGAGVRAQDALRAATATPARILGRSAQLGHLRPGLLGDALVVSEGFELRGVLRRGQWLRQPAATGRA